VNTRAERMTWMPGWDVWLALVALLGVGLLGNWFVAAGLAVLLIRQYARPFDFLTSYALVAAGAAFIRYEAGMLTRELGLLSLLILFMLVSYAVSHLGRGLMLPKTRLLLPLLAYAGISLANYARGVLAGNSLKYATLELLPPLGLASALLVANVFDPARHLRTALRALLVIGYGSAALGLYFFSIYHVRMAGVYYTPVPGLIAMLAVNLALRARRTAGVLGWSMLALPLLLHQFVSFTRGMWLGSMAGLLASFLFYVGWGRGSGSSWRRAGLVFACVVGLGAAGALGLGLVLGQTDFLSLAGNRFTSIGGTGFTHQTASNLVRLAEYAEVIPRIAASPWLGHGLGYTFLFREPLGFKVQEQWYSHEIYLFVWLKQGVVGLLAFLWMLWTATVFGVQESRRRGDEWESAWLATAAACTVLLAVLDLSNFQLASVNSIFVLALLWGGAMAIGRTGFIHLRWASPKAAIAPARDP
jgi:hypothetical protein